MICFNQVSKMNDRIDFIIEATLEYLANEIKEIVNDTNFYLEYDERYNDIKLFSRDKEIVEKIANLLDREVYYNSYDGYFVVIKDYHEMNEIFQINGVVA